MSFIEIIEGSFPAQRGMFLKKSAFVQQAALALTDTGKKQIFYNIRNAIQSVEIITPDDKKPGVKIALKDGKVIVARTDRKTIEDIRLIIAAGPDEDGGMFITQPEKKAKGVSPHPLIAKTGRFITWTIGAFLGICALASFNVGSWYVGTVFLIVAIAIVPPVLGKVPVFKKKHPASKAVSIVLLGVIALIIGALFSPSTITKIGEQEKKQQQVKNDAPPPVASPKAPKPKKAYTPTERDARINATVLCEMRVKDGLRAPRTAKFPWSKEVSFNGKTATLVSYVDAENGFGAMIRTHYVCTVDYVGGKPMDTSSWRLTDVATLD